MSWSHLKTKGAPVLQKLTRAVRYPVNILANLTSIGFLHDPQRNSPSNLFSLAGLNILFFELSAAVKVAFQFDIIASSIYCLKLHVVQYKVYYR